jgi:hypothetical protein
MSSRVHNIGPHPVGPYIPRTTDAIDCKGLAVRVNRFGRFPSQKRPPAPSETKATSKYRAKVLVVVVVVGLFEAGSPIEKRNPRWASKLELT